MSPGTPRSPSGLVEDGAHPDDDAGGQRTERGGSGRTDPVRRAGLASTRTGRVPGRCRPVSGPRGRTRRCGRATTGAPSPRRARAVPRRSPPRTSSQPAALAVNGTTWTRSTRPAEPVSIDLGGPSNHRSPESYRVHDDVHGAVAGGLPHGVDHRRRERCRSFTSRGPRIGSSVVPVGSRRHPVRLAGTSASAYSPLAMLVSTTFPSRGNVGGRHGGGMGEEDPRLAGPDRRKRRRGRCSRPGRRRRRRDGGVRRRCSPPAGWSGWSGPCPPARRRTRARGCPTPATAVPPSPRRVPVS